MLTGKKLKSAGRKEPQFKKLAPQDIAVRYFLT